MAKELSNQDGDTEPIDAKFTPRAPFTRFRTVVLRDKHNGSNKTCLYTGDNNLTLYEFQI